MLGETACGEAGKAILDKVARCMVGKATLYEATLGGAVLIKIHTGIKRSPLGGDAI